MKRRNFLRDIALGITAAICPKFLHPVELENASREKAIADLLTFIRTSPINSKQKSEIHVLRKAIRCNGKIIDIEFFQKMFPENHC